MTNTDLAIKIASFKHDPLGFVEYVFPWNQPGPLHGQLGPDVWQARVLNSIGKQLRAGVNPIRIAVASGHGVGKTAMSAWLVIWWISCFRNPNMVVTANTQNQLNTKTWRELAKWKAMAIHGDWYEWTATQLKLKESASTWYATATPWSAGNAQSFAGLHEDFPFMLFDEASTIIDTIWETSEGFLTPSKSALWVCFGNPTEATGRFRQCWTKFADRWTTFNVDASRSKLVSEENRKVFQEWIQDYGYDSDFVRVRVRGEFPRQSSEQLISEAVVDKAIARDLEEEFTPTTEPLLMGVDVARHGGDESVIVLRRGRIMHPEIFDLRVPDLMAIASHAERLINLHNPDQVFVDSVGLGYGVVDRLRQLGHMNIIDVQVGENADNKDIYFNRRIEIWDRMKTWLNTADIPDDQKLKEDLIAPLYMFDNKEKFRLEQKKDMKIRGLPSPDRADALALTFSHLIPSRIINSEYAEEYVLEPEFV